MIYVTNGTHNQVEHLYCSIRTSDTLNGLHDFNLHEYKSMCELNGPAQIE